MTRAGKVYLIGSGPGDPGLITLRGVQCLQRSDVIVYDYLVGKEILRHAKEGSRFIYVGKKGGDHTVSQERLNDLLVEEALKGNIVARLKGGDPFIFGRGGEEAQVLTEAGITFEIIPGVTSAIAAPAYAGIPLTHREFASSLALVTGHEDPTKAESSIDWEHIAALDTLVFLMGVRNIPSIVQELVRNGRKPDTPVALIRWGTTPDQQTLTGNLGNIVELVQKNRFLPPAVFVVGDVVKLRDTLNWFEKKPLFGKGVIITRPAEQAQEIAGLLHEEGARVLYFPTIQIVPPENYKGLDRALGSIESYSWIVFTSVNGVRYFFNRLLETDGDIRDLKGIRIAAIGPATARAIRKYGIHVDLVPETYVAESVVEAFQDQNIDGCAVLLPRAETARDVIPEGLQKLGARVDIVTAYRTVTSGKTRAEFESLLEDNQIDVLTFTSPSTVYNFVDIMEGQSGLPETVKIACIGPVTEAAARKAGFMVDIVGEPYTIPGMMDVLVQYFQKGKQ